MESAALARLVGDAICAKATAAENKINTDRDVRHSRNRENPPIFAGV